MPHKAGFKLSGSALALAAALCTASPLIRAADAKSDTRVDPRGAVSKDMREPRRDGAEGASAKDREAAFMKPFVTVNGAPQPVGMAEILLREQLLRGANDGPELRNGVRDAMVNNALMEQEARKAGLDKNPLVQAQMELARQRVLVNAWQQRVVTDEKIGDAQVQAEYDRQMQRFAPTEVRIRQVLLADEVGAKLLLEKATAGAKLDDLAREYSREPNVKTSGGLSDWINTAELLPPLADAIKDLPKGKLVNRAVQTPNGWHVVQVEEVRPFKAPTLEEVKPQIVSLLQQRAVQDRLKTVKDRAKVQ